MLEPARTLAIQRDGPGYAVVHLQGSKYGGAAERTLCGICAPALWSFDWTDAPPDDVACQRCRAAYQRRAAQEEPHDERHD